MSAGDAVEQVADGAQQRTLAGLIGAEDQVQVGAVGGQVQGEIGERAEGQGHRRAILMPRPGVAQGFEQQCPHLADQRRAAWWRHGVLQPVAQFGGQAAEQLAHRGRRLQRHGLLIEAGKQDGGQLIALGEHGQVVDRRGGRLQFLDPDPIAADGLSAGLALGAPPPAGLGPAPRAARCCR